LGIAKLDAIDVKYGLAVCLNKGVEGEDLEHLECGYQRTATLLNDVVN